MKLYGFPPSPRTWKVRAVAAHLGIPLQLEFVDLGKGEQRSPAYLAINPTGRTPTLVDGDFVLWEAEAIIQYLAGRAPNALWPDDARLRAEITRWQSWELAHWGKEACEPIIVERLVKQVLNLGPPDAAVVEKATAAFHRETAVLDAHLARQPWLVGSQLTLADLSLAAVLFVAEPAQLPVVQYHNVLAWFGRVSALPAWRETAPPPLPVAA
jgi:glutathione S-transferase